MVIDWDETSVHLYQEMRHADGQPAAAFRTRLQHVDSRNGRPFAWSQKTRERLDSLRGTPPEQTRPRGLDPDIDPVPDDLANLDQVKRCGAPEIGRGMVMPHHCDSFGRMQAAWFMGRISDSVPNLLYGWRQKVAAAQPGARMGAAVLEYRLIYRHWPEAGDRFAIHSSLAEAGEKTHRLAHWVMDPQSGKAWVTSEAVAVTFDLNQRKIIPTPAEHLAELARLAPPGLKL